MTRLLIFLALVVSPLASLRADTNPSIPIMIADVQLTFVVPDGFCIPENKVAEFSSQFATIDRNNATHFTLIDCKELAKFEAEPGVVRRYAMLKTPRRAFTKNWGTDRAAFLGEIEKASSSRELEQEYETWSKQWRQRIEQNLEGVRFGETRDLGTIAIDDNALYMAMVYTMSFSGDEFVVAGVFTITIVQQKIVMYYLYDEYIDPSTVTGLLKDVQTHVAAFVRDND